MPTWEQIAVVALTIVGAGMGYWLKTIGDRVEDARNELSSFRIEVAKNYTTHEVIAALEKRLIDLLDRIEKKIDRNHGTD